MVHLKSIELRPTQEIRRFPFNVPSIRALSGLTFSAGVTFFVGENGAGKSTLLEALAIASSAITVGSASAERDPGLAGVQHLAKQLRLGWTKRTRKGFFLRAEDFFGYARHMSQLRAELEQERNAVDEEYAGRSDMA